MPIAAVAEATQGRMRLDVTGEVAGSSVQVFRRDSAGVQVVRDTSEGGVVVAAGGTVTILDYEAQQGVLVTYILANADGVERATTTATPPLWGTWLKSPGKPFLNTRCYFTGEDSPSRRARREVVEVEGSPQLVVLSDVRTAPGGSVQLGVLTAAQQLAVQRILDDGSVVMLDLDPAWAVPFRYVSVGDVREGRAYGGGELALTAPVRVVELAELVSVRAPTGRSQVNAGASYAQLPTKFATYATIPATTATYEALVL